MLNPKNRGGGLRADVLEQFHRPHYWAVRSCHTTQYYRDYRDYHELNQTRLDPLRILYPQQ